MTNNNNINNTPAVDREAVQARFVEIFKDKIKREGADKLLEYLLSPSCDFFRAPASTKYHGCYPGGLAQHSLNVYDCLCDILARPRYKEVYGQEYSEETIAIVALLHDVCKIGCYQESTRNVKNAEGKWESIPTYQFDDPVPYGHGSKSVYMLSAFMKLTRDEAFAIRFHMGFAEDENKNTVGKAFELYPLGFALSTADMEATYYLEKAT